jgi:hypothetical protein
MATVKIKGYINATKHAWNEDVTYSFNTMAIDSHGYVPVMPFEIEFELPSALNIIALQVASLEKTKTALRAEFDKRVAEINDQISKLQCLEFNPS